MIMSVLYKKAFKVADKVIFQNVLVYVLPIVVFIIQALITGSIPPSIRLKYFFSPLFILYVVLSVVVPLGIIAVCGIFIKKNIDGPNAMEAVNRISMLFLRLTIVVPGLLSFTLPVFAFNHEGETIFHAIACLMQLFGSVGLGGLLGYVFFMPSFEKFLSFVPFESKYMALPLRVNMFLLGLLTILGAIAMCLGPILLVSEVAEGVNLTSYILTRVLPVAAMATVLGSTAYNISMHHVTDHIQKITETTYLLAQGDYSIERLQVTNRNELGLLINDMNMLMDGMRDIIGNIDSSVRETRSTASTLTTNIEHSETQVQAVVDSVTLVKNEMINQSASVEETQATINTITRTTIYYICIVAHRAVIMNNICNNCVLGSGLDDI